MNDVLKRALRDNWYLVLLLTAVLASGIVGYARSRSTEPPLTPDVKTHLVSTNEQAPSASTPATPQAEREKAQNVLEEYRAKYEANPKGEDAPALLAAMGNLYRQKEGNYREAAQCFERLIADHPDAPGIRDAYLQLVTCYERAGDEENRRRVLRRIVEVFPSDSQESAYASSLLYR